MTNPAAFEAAARRVASRYRATGPAAGRFVATKLRRDPVFRQLASRCPLLGPVVDLGCGLGHASVLLLELQPELSAVAIDQDLRKLRRAARIAAGLPRLETVHSDVRLAPLRRAGTVLLVDVLHYCPARQQDALLEAAARSLVPGGRIFVRDLDAAAGWRAAMTRGQERLARWTGWNRGDTLHYRPARELVAVLEASGLAVAVEPSWQGTPFGNVLITATA